MLTVVEYLWEQSLVVGPTIVGYVLEQRQVIVDYLQEQSLVVGYLQEIHFVVYKFQETHFHM